MKIKKTNQGELIFLGTGSSDGIPKVSCLTQKPITCKVCKSAVKPDSKNRRRNTSIALKTHSASSQYEHTIIDAGKTFWESSIKFFPLHDIRRIDNIVITHSHADAIGGLDYLRDWTNFIQDTVTINLRYQDLEALKKVYFYLFENGKVKTKGPIPKIKFNIIDETPFYSGILKMTPVPVFHGNKYISFGYKFGKVGYIPDVSEIPKSSEKLLENLDVLIIDALRSGPAYFSHFTLSQALEAVKKLKPKKAYFTDLTCSIDHEETNLALKDLSYKESLNMELAYDGLSFKFNW